MHVCWFLSGLRDYTFTNCMLLPSVDTAKAKWSDGKFKVRIRNAVWRCCKKPADSVRKGCLYWLKDWSHATRPALNTAPTALLLLLHLYFVFSASFHLCLLLSRIIRFDCWSQHPSFPSQLLVKTRGWIRSSTSKQQSCLSLFNSYKTDAQYTQQNKRRKQTNALCIFNQFTCTNLQQV